MQIQKALDGSTEKVTDKDAVLSSHDSGVGSETCSETGADSQQVDSQQVDSQEVDNEGSYDQEEDGTKSQVEAADA